MRMIALAVLLCLLSFAPANARNWVASTEYYYSPDQPRAYGDVYVMTRLSSGCTGICTENTWVNVDLKQTASIPADAKWADLAGILIITHGSAVEVADLQIAFRKPGDTSANCGAYIGQATESAQKSSAYMLQTDGTYYVVVGGGARSNFASKVPLSNGTVDICYKLSTPGAYPNNSSYGINLAVQAWGR